MSKALVNEVKELLNQLDTKIFVVARPVTDLKFYSPLEKENIPMVRVNDTTDPEWAAKLHEGLTKKEPLLIDYSSGICELLIRDQKEFFLVYPTRRFVSTELEGESQEAATELLDAFDGLKSAMVTKIRVHRQTTFVDTLRLAVSTQKRESQPAPSSNEDCSKGSC